MTLALRNISKSFDGVLALDRVDFELRPGEVHALVGENGAGKSTLINIMAGVHKPSSGTMELDGRALRLEGPRDAVAAGISIVPQERHVVPDASVAENVFLNRLPVRRGLVDYATLHRDAARWLKVVGLDVDPGDAGHTLSPGQGQMLDLARAISLECRYLLLDEPTASIGPNEAERLFGVVRDLKASGHALLFVSHKLDEVFAVCERVTVIRDGKAIILGADVAAVSEEKLIEAMVGREFVRSAARSGGARKPGGETALELQQVATRHGHRDVSFGIGSGEVVALYGLVGAGRTELARAVVGLDKVTDGKVLVNGKAIHPRHPAEALRRHHIAYISEDRRGEGLIMEDTIARNASIAIWDRLAEFGGWARPRRIWPAVRGPVEALGVKMTAPGQVVGDLSGGNQQKVSVVKWLVADADIFMFDEPTVGVDVKAKDEIHHLIGSLADEGRAVLVISSDLREVVDIADRVLVMVSGTVCSDLENDHDYERMSRKIMEAITTRRGSDPSRRPPGDDGERGASPSGAL